MNKNLIKSIAEIFDGEVTDFTVTTGYHIIFKNKRSALFFVEMTEYTKDMFDVNGPHVVDENRWYVTVRTT